MAAVLVYLASAAAAAAATTSGGARKSVCSVPRAPTGPFRSGGSGCSPRGRWLFPPGAPSGPPATQMVQATLLKYTYLQSR